MKAVVLLLIFKTIVLVSGTGIFGPGYNPLPCIDGYPNATRTDCGNLCENSCEYIGSQIPHHWFEISSVFCIPGCTCQENYIRNDGRECVPQRRSSCGEFIFIECLFNKTEQYSLHNTLFFILKTLILAKMCRTHCGSAVSGTVDPPVSKRTVSKMVTSTFAADALVSQAMLSI
jgi:Trypsin Inhibitor like cysteine rich domain